MTITNSKTVKRALPFLLAFSFQTAAGSEETDDDWDLIVWHPFITTLEKLHKDWIEDYARQKRLRIRIENGFDINTALRKKVASIELPDLVIGPSDLLDLDDIMPLATFPATEFPKQQLHFRKQKAVGVRLFENGRLLFMRKREELSPGSLESLLGALRGGKTIAWRSSEPFNLLPFLIRANTTSSDPLRDYAKILHASNMPIPCNHECLWNALETRTADFAIVGDWLLPELQMETWISDYVLEALPGYFGPCPSLPYVAFFPERLHSSPKRLSASKGLVSQLTSSKTQSAMLKSLIVPASAGAKRSHSWPSWLGRSLEEPESCLDVSALTTPIFWALGSETVRETFHSRDPQGRALVALRDMVKTFLKGGQSHE